MRKQRWKDVGAKIAKLGYKMVLRVDVYKLTSKMTVSKYSPAHSPIH